MITQWNDAEDDALQGLPIRAQIIYLRGLRRYMDYSTGIVGDKRGVCLKGLAEISQEEVNRKIREQPTKHAIRASLEQLKRAGLIERIEDGERLVFFLPKASWDKSDQNNNRTDNRTTTAQQPHTQPHTKTIEQDNEINYIENNNRTGKNGFLQAPPISPHKQPHTSGYIPDTGYRIVEVVSNLEVVGSEKPKIPKKERAAPPALPDWLNHEAWSLFEQHRKKKRKPLDELSRPLLLNKLRTLTQDQQRQVIEYSISAGYPDLYPDCLNKPQADKNERERARREAIWSTDF